MDEEIVLDRGGPTIMKLDSDEQAMMDEIRISVPRPPQMRRPAPQQQQQQQAPQRRVQEDMNVFANPNKQVPPTRPPAEEVDYGEDEDFGYGGGDEPQEDEQPSEGYKTIDEEKADILNKLTRLEKKGFTLNKRLNAYSPVEELRSEIKRIMYAIEVDQSVKFSRRMLVACVTGLEFLNKRYNPFEFQLEGWSESVMENLDDYDGVFEELYSKYKTKVQVAPEVKLIMMLGGSAMMFHLTNSMFKAAIPNMNDVLKQNPGLVQNMMQAVQNTKPRSEEASAAGGRREMRGPGIDISSLMGGIMMPPPPPMNTTITSVPEEDDDDISDIISVSGDSTGGEVKEVSVSKGKRGKGKKKIEINL